MSKKRRAIITGATGFVGHHLCRHLLDEGWDVIGLCRRGHVSDEFSCIEMPESINALVDVMSKIHPDMLFHVAGLVLPEHREGGIDNLLQSNIAFGTRILEAMSLAGVRNFINTGTSWQTSSYESAEYCPANLYAATKEAFEKILAYYSSVRKIHTITLRLFDTYGVNDPRPKLINILINALKTNSRIDMTSGEQEMDLVHVHDVCAAYLRASELLLNNEKTRSVYGVSSNEPMTVMQFVAFLERLANKKINAHFGARPYRSCEVMKTQKCLPLLPGWKCEISLKDGMERLLISCGMASPSDLKK